MVIDCAITIKNLELSEKYGNHWTQEVILEKKELILKCNHIVMSRVIELFEFAMPRTMMLDEVERWFSNSTSTNSSYWCWKTSAELDC